MPPSLAQVQVRDHGPLYAETDLARFPVEPANTFSNLIFLALLLYAWRRLARTGLVSVFYTVVLILLGLGWVGGTAYHATRSSAVWLALDFVPIALLCGLAAARLIGWLSPARRRWYAWGIAPGLGLVWLLGGWLLPRPLAINTGYALLGLLVALPAVMHCAEAGWARARLLGGALGAFAVALGFRRLDAWLIADHPRLGTHFLWHLCGGLAAWCLLLYLLRAEEDRRTAAGSGVRK